jgi:hypothetical protein
MFRCSSRLLSLNSSRTSSVHIFLIILCPLSILYKLNTSVSSHSSHPDKLCSNLSVKRSADEMSTCSSSSTDASALGKWTYKKTAGHTDHTATAVSGGAGRRGPQGSATAGDSDSALLPAPGKRRRRVRDAGRTPIPKSTQGPPPPPIFGRWRRWRSCRGRGWASRPLISGQRL